MSGVVVHNCHPSTQEAETGELLWVWATEWNPVEDKDRMKRRQRKRNNNSNSNSNNQERRRRRRVGKEQLLVVRRSLLSARLPSRPHIAVLVLRIPSLGIFYKFQQQHPPRIVLSLCLSLAHSLSQSSGFVGFFWFWLCLFWCAHKHIHKFTY